MLIAGKMMWAEIVNANCSRASTRTSLVSSIRLALLSEPRPALLRKALFGLDALADLAQPRAMMLPRPTGRHPAARHGANRSFDPDPGVNVHDDGEDQDERE